MDIIVISRFGTIELHGGGTDAAFDVTDGTICFTLDHTAKLDTCHRMISLAVDDIDEIKSWTPVPGTDNIVLTIDGKKLKAHKAPNELMAKIYMTFVAAVRRHVEIDNPFDVDKVTHAIYVEFTASID